MRYDMDTVPSAHPDERLGHRDHAIVEDDMIRQTSQGYQVVSEKTGKPLSRPDLTKAEAEERLRVIEYFKRIKGGS